LADPVYDVAIIGCGPVGAMAAILAGRAGLSTLVIDREAVPHPLPRAVHLDAEVMRLFQNAGLADAVLPGMRETEGHLHIGADGGAIRYMGTAHAPRPFGWSNDYFFYQPELEDRLRDGLARFPAVDLRLGTDLLHFEQDAQGVSLILQQADGDRPVRARWVVACDGARSQVRKGLGIALDDLRFEEPWLVVDVEADAPVRFPKLWGVPDGADLQQLSVMMCDPARPATVVPGRGKVRRWEFMLLPGEDDAAMMAPDRVAALLAPYLDGVPHRVLRASTYRFHGLIAERWRDGRVFLAGDAAHQTPPFFGQGMCHGMRDISNLLWKLTLVVRAQAAPALLDSYQPERDPHVRHVVSAAVEAGRYICELDPARAAARDQAMRERAREGRTGTAADLIPPYAAGVIGNGFAAQGERFIQPRVGAGRGALLDDAVGGGWRLFATDAAMGQARRATEALSPVPVTVVTADDLDDGGAVARWLADRQVAAVLVRPDNYVFGAGEPVALAEAAGQALHLLREPAAVA
jgi:3-(3-hydroxy-phenyl)propionate hydroxylase